MEVMIPIAVVTTDDILIALGVIAVTWSVVLAWRAIERDENGQ